MLELFIITYLCISTLFFIYFLKEECRGSHPVDLEGLLVIGLLALLWLPLIILLSTIILLEECNKFIIKVFNKGETK